MCILLELSNLYTCSFGDSPEQKRFAVHCVLSSFATIFKRKRELVVLLLLSYGRLVSVNVP